MTMNKIVMGAAGSGVGTGWIGLLGNTGGAGDETAKAITTDSSGNVYMAGASGTQVPASPSTGVSNYPQVLLVKFDKFGNILFQKQLFSSYTGSKATGITLDSSGNIYVCGIVASGTSYGIIAKYNSSGVFQWQRILDDWYFGYSAITADSSGNIYASGAYLVKYNSSGTLQFQKYIGTSNTSDYEGWYGVQIASNGDIYLGGYNTINGRDVALCKCNSAGTVQWTVTLGGSGWDECFGMTLDEANNSVYVCGVQKSEGVAQWCSTGIIAKYDLSGTLQWQRVLGTGTQENVAKSISKDSSGNVYISGYAGNSALIAKYNSSGTLQWQRTLSSSDPMLAHCIKVDSSGFIHVGGQIRWGNGGDVDIYNLQANGPDLFVAKLPSDGSLTGTYNGFTYAASSQTAATSTLTAGTISMQSSNTSATEAAGTLTQYTSTLALTKITI